jgi:hypothetical protein
MVLTRENLEAIRREYSENLTWEPYESKRKLKSAVWKYVLCPYVFGNLITRRFVLCTKCGDPIYWLGSTSNLKVHFKRNHPDIPI